VLGVTSLPYVFAFTTEPASKVFMGFFVNGADMNSYLAKMREGAAGQWAWTNHYTTESSPPVYIFVWLLLWGHLAALLHVSLYAAFQLFRVTGAVALFVAAWIFIHHYLADERARRFALYLLAFTMGFGILTWAIGQPVVLGHQLDAMDLRMPEISAFFSILTGPTWPAAFVVLGAVLTLRAAATGSLALGAAAALAWLGEASMHPQLLVLLFAALAAGLVLRPPTRRGLVAVAVAVLPPLPYLGYSYWISAHSTAVLRWQAQGVDSFAPDAISLAIGLLPLVAGAALALPGVLRRRSREDVVIVAWLVLVAAVRWIPNPASVIGRRFVDAIFVPLACLAADGVYRVLLPRFREIRAQRLVPFSYVAVSAITPAFVVLALIGAAHSAQYTLPRAQYDSLTWLARQPTGVVLSSAELGLYVPAYTDDTVYVGHYSETYQYARKDAEARALLSGGADLRSFVARNGITYVIWTPQDGESPPASLGRPGFYEDGVSVFAVRT
jgi:hypothetical protein